MSEHGTLREVQNQLYFDECGQSATVFVEVFFAFYLLSIFVAKVVTLFSTYFNIFGNLLSVNGNITT